MASKLIDKLLLEAYGSARKRTINKKARQRVDSAGLHLIGISVDDIYSILMYNYVAIRMSKSVTAEKKRLVSTNAEDISRSAAAENVANRNTESMSKLRSEARQIAQFIFRNFIAEYNKQVTEVTYQAAMVNGEIQVLQPSNQAIKVKTTILNILETNSADTLFKNLVKGRARKSFTRRTQFLHVGRTVGTQILKDLSNLTPSGDSAARDAALKIIERMLDQVEFDWKLNDSYTKRGIQVFGRIGQTLANAPGQESTDWKVLRPTIESALKSELELKGIQFAEGESSQPFDQRLTQNFINEQIIEPLKKKGAKAVKYRVENPKNKNSKIKNTNKPKAIKAGNLKTGSRKKITARNSKIERGPASEPLRLMALMNQRISDVVVKNMGSPGLEYRTGRFASSVEITDITKTPKGYPSIGYRYMKNPYQTFEPGYRQGSSELDPRRLIDKSIREVAAEFAIGRFYTRRV